MKTSAAVTDTMTEAARTSDHCLFVNSLKALRECGPVTITLAAQPVVTWIKGRDVGRLSPGRPHAGRLVWSRGLTAVTLHLAFVRRNLFRIGLSTSPVSLSLTLPSDRR